MNETSELIFSNVKNTAFHLLDDKNVDVDTILQVVDFAVDDGKIIDAALEIIDRGKTAVSKIRGSRYIQHFHPYFNVRMKFHFELYIARRQRILWRFVGRTGNLEFNLNSCIIC